MTARGSSPGSSSRVFTTGSRLIVGAAAAVALVVGVVVGVPAPLPGILATAARTVVTPEAGDTVLVCNGPFRALGREVTDALEMQAAGETRVRAGGLGEIPEPVLLDAPGLRGGSGVPVFVLAPGEPAADVAQSITLRDPDLTGFAAGACRSPSMQAWIVGGAASVGTSDVLTIANPGEVAATVTLTTFGGEAASARTLVVPPRSQVALPLAAAAIGVSAPVVHVSAEGAPVHAALQSSLVRTLDPGGIDLQDTAGLPDTELVIAGVQVGEGSQEEMVRLRLLSPGAATTAQVTVRRAGESGEAAPPQTVTLAPGEPIEVGLSGLPGGTYSVHVRAGQPVVGAVWQSTGTHPGSDFAWMTPAPEVEGSIVATIPAGANARLHLVGGDAERTVLVTDIEEGTVREIAIAGGSSALVSLRRDRSYRIESEGPIRAAVAMYGTDLLAGWPLWSPPSEAAPVVVYP